MRYLKWSSLGIAIAALVVLGGCGGGDDSKSNSFNTGSTPSPTVANGYVGAAQCIECHNSFSWSTKLVADFLASPHVIHSSYISASDKNRADGCLECHNLIGDGNQLEGLIDPADVPKDGLTAVTCEACHGEGAAHWKGGKIPYPEPDYKRCGLCHNVAVDHNERHPESDHIVEDYLAGSHYTAEIGMNARVCSRCHTDEGARKYKNLTKVADIDARVKAVENASTIQCRTCHDPHNPEKLLKAKSASASAEYNTCTNCHQNHDINIGSSVNYYVGDDGASGDLIYHAERWDRVIATTHYDIPNTLDKIEGFVLSRTNSRVCRDCHNVHSADLTINRQWSRSGHAGRIGKKKAAAAASEVNYTLAQTGAVRKAGTTAGPFTEFPMVTDERTECVRCHTSTGAVAYLSYLKGKYDPAKFDPTAIPAPTDTDPNATRSLYDADGKFPQVIMERTWDPAANWGSGGWSYTKLQRELIYCWACHSDNAGGIRNPGAVSADYLAGDGVTAATFPDLKSSNVCVSCHSGRESGGNIKADTGDFSNRSFINSHYFAAGAVMFQTGGYEYGGNDYTPKQFYHHDEIGMGASSDLAAWEAANGTDGPCAGCHMSSKEGHLLTPVEKNANRVITAITASVCINCHDGGHGAPPFVAKGGAAADVAAAAAFLETEKGHLHASLEALEAMLGQSGFFFTPSYPYFYADTNANGILDPAEVSSRNAVRNWVTASDPTGKLNMGAAFNYNILEHDPGAYAHNRFYTKRLIYDSIDHLDDGILNGSVGATIDTLAAAGLITHDGGFFTAAEAAEAKAYLDGDSKVAGVQRP